MSSHQRRKCRCGKVLCRSLDQARTLHARVWAQHGGQTEVRFYACQYGAFHWTRQLEPNQHQRTQAA